VIVADSVGECVVDRCVPDMASLALASASWPARYDKMAKAKERGGPDGAKVRELGSRFSGHEPR
jgi:hypothetical protein